MGLFNRNKQQINNSNPNEGGFRIIEHDFAENEIAYKYPVENFYSGSIVFVKPGQEVLFVMDEAIEPLQQGRYELETKNVPPRFAKFIKLYNNVEMYHCYIYFINKEKAIKCFWGTPDPILVDSAKYRSTFGIVANGSYTLVIDNSVELFKSTIGQLTTYNSDDIDDFLFNEVLQYIVSKIGTVLEKENVLFSRLQAETLSIAKSLTAQLEEDRVFENYGFKLKSGIAIRTLSICDEDMEKVKKADEEFLKSEISKTKIVDQGSAEAIVALQKGNVENELLRNRGLIEAEIMKSKGEYYAQERSYDVLQAAASNEGGSQIGGGNVMTTAMGLGMGLGLGQGFGRAMSDVTTNAMSPINQNVQQQRPNVNSSSVKCPSCGQLNQTGAKFCSSCGGKMVINVFCSNCGAENQIGAKFCSSCGNPLETKSDVIICPNCKQENKIGSAFCSSCGKGLKE